MASIVGGDDLDPDDQLILDPLSNQDVRYQAYMRVFVATFRKLADLEDCVRAGSDWTALVAMGAFIEIAGGLARGTHEAGNGAANFAEFLRFLPRAYADTESALRAHTAKGSPKHAEAKVIKRELPVNAGLYAVFRCGFAHEGAPKIAFTMTSSGKLASGAGIGYRELKGTGLIQVDYRAAEILDDLKAGVKSLKKAVLRDSALAQRVCQAVIQP